MFVKAISILMGLISLGSTSSMANMADVFKQRREHLQKVCAKYNDELKYEYLALHGEREKFTHMPEDSVNEYFTCAQLPQWHEYWNQVRLNTINSAAAAAAAKQTTKAKRELHEFKGILSVQHPFQKIRDMYFVGFRISKDYTNTVNFIRDWVNSREEKFINSGEEVVRFFDGTQSVTFRQFVNFLTKCPEEHPVCHNVVRGPFFNAFRPYWEWCLPCNKHLDYQYIHHESNATSEAEWIVQDMGLLDDGIEMPDLNRGQLWKNNKSQIDNEPSVYEYFSKLSQQEIVDLYDRFKLDFELFDFSIEDFLANANDAAAESKTSQNTINQ